MILSMTDEQIIYEGKYSPQDVIDLKNLFIKLLISHHKLADNEYKRNPTYNDSHYSAIAEQGVIDYCNKHDINVVNLLTPPKEK